MIGKILKGVWTHLQIAFSNNYTMEGFERTNKKFELPPNLIELDPVTKRRLTICNLFANQNLSIFEIVKVLDSSLHQVVPALIENGLIKERRRNPRGTTPPKGKHSSGLSILPDDIMKASGNESESQTQATKAHSVQTSGSNAYTIVHLTTNSRRMAS